LETWTLAYFREALADAGFWPSFLLTARVAVVSTIVSAVAGTALAIAAAAAVPASWRLRVALQLPLYLPHVVAANMILLVFAQSGLFARVLHVFGLAPDVGDAPLLVYDAFGTGIALGFAFKETPFVAVLVYPFAAEVLATYGKAARTLGAGPLATARRIVLPMTWPALATASILVFAYGFGSFDVPYVLGRTYPKVLSAWAYELYTNVDHASRPLAMAVGVLIVGVNAVFVALYFLAARRYEASLAALRAGRTT